MTTEKKKTPPKKAATKKKVAGFVLPDGSAFSTGTVGAKKRKSKGPVTPPPAPELEKGPSVTEQIMMALFEIAPHIPAIKSVIKEFTKPDEGKGPILFEVSVLTKTATENTIVPNVSRCAVTQNETVLTIWQATRTPGKDAMLCIPMSNVQSYFISPAK